MTLTFTDSAGNPLPAAIRADFYAGSVLNGSAVYSGYIQVGGTIDPGTNLTSGSQYTVAFVGTLAPAGSVTFTYSAQTLIIPNYQSPTLSQANFASRQASRWVRGAFGSSARQSGGIAYNLAYGLSYALITASQQIQQIMQAMRLPSSIGTSVDSWVSDFFGNRLPRAAGEDDPTYINRAQANLSAKKGLRSGILTIAGFFGSAWVNEPWNTAETGGYGTTNSTCGYGVAGGYGSQKPLVQVFVEPNAGVNSSQMKSSVLAARAAGIRTQVISVTPGANGEGWGIGGFGSAHFGIASQNDGVIL